VADFSTLLKTYGLSTSPGQYAGDGRVRDSACHGVEYVLALAKSALYQGSPLLNSAGELLDDRGSTANCSARTSDGAGGARLDRCGGHDISERVAGRLALARSTGAHRNFMTGTINAHAAYTKRAARQLGLLPMATRFLH